MDYHGCGALGGEDVQKMVNRATSPQRRSRSATAPSARESHRRHRSRDRSASPPPPQQKQRSQTRAISADDVPVVSALGVDAGNSAGQQRKDKEKEENEKEKEKEEEEGGHPQQHQGLERSSSGDVGMMKLALPSPPSSGGGRTRRHTVASSSSEASEVAVPRLRPVASRVSTHSPAAPQVASSPSPTTWDPFGDAFVAKLPPQAASPSLPVSAAPTSPTAGDLLS
jgi:hypothetical protein